MVTLIYSCENEEILPEQDNSFLEDARTFFEELAQSVAGENTQPENTLSPGNLNPLWKNAMAETSARFEYLYIPFTGGNHFIAVHEPQVQKGIKYKYVRIGQILSITRNKQTGAMEACVLSFIPTQEYYRQNKKNPAVKFLSRTDRAEFSGIVIVHAYYNMHLMNINKYAGGKKESGLSVLETKSKQDFVLQKDEYLKNISIFRHSQILTRSDTIQPPSTPTPPGEDSTPTTSNDSVPETTAEDDDIAIYIEGEEVIVTPEEDSGNTSGCIHFNGSGCPVCHQSSGYNENNNENNENDNDNDNDNGSTGYLRPPADKCKYDSETPYLNQICQFALSDIKISQQRAIERGINELIRKYPYAKQLFDLLISSKVKVAIKYDPKMRNASIKYNINQETLTFSHFEMSGVGGIGALEDWAHVIQCQIFYKDKMTRPNTRNLEFEAKVFCDINCWLNEDQGDMCGSIEQGLKKYSKLLDDFRMLSQNNIQSNKGFTNELTFKYIELGLRWDDPEYNTGSFDPNKAPSFLIDFF